jgi:hypothetical protein
MKSKKLTDIEVYDLLHAAVLPIMYAKGETAFGETTLRTAEKALFTLQMAALVKAEGIDPKSLSQDRNNSS